VNRVQIEDFCLATEYQNLRQASHGTAQETGAIVTFSGLVREFSPTGTSSTLTLQHYPGMTEKVLDNIEASARERWSLGKVCIIHRVGELVPGDQIVFVGVTSKHRKAAFEAAQYIMDLLKTQAPFWKKEGEKWVEAKESDQRSAQHWFKS